MKCAHCPVEGSACLGERAGRLCQLASTRPDYRRLLVEQARGAAGAGPAASSLDALLAEVSGCRDRGPTLPHSAQAGCGCGELTECRAGRGRVPGRVTLSDCLACVSCRASAATGEAAPG